MILREWIYVFVAGKFSDKQILREIKLLFYFFLLVSSLFFYFYQHIVQKIKKKPVDIIFIALKWNFIFISFFLLYNVIKNSNNIFRANVTLYTISLMLDFSNNVNYNWMFLISNVFFNKCLNLKLDFY